MNGHGSKLRRKLDHAVTLLPSRSNKQGLIFAATVSIVNDMQATGYVRVSAKRQTTGSLSGCARG
jgi:hypothetical protein